MPFPPESSVRNHEDQRKDRSSILHLYRRLIALRQNAPALTLGDFELLALPDGLLGFRRTLGEEVWIVLINFTGRTLDDVDRGSVSTGLRVVVSSGGPGEDDIFDGTLGADQAVVLTR